MAGRGAGAGFPGRPTCGRGRAIDTVAADRGKASFGRRREREKAFMADRCLPKVGFRICKNRSPIRVQSAPAGAGISPIPSR